VLAATLALVGFANDSRGEPKKPPAAAETAKAVDLDALVEIARARDLPPGLDESSPELTKIVALVEAGKLKSARSLITKYAKANKAHLNDAARDLLASWIVRRALLLPDKKLFTVIDRLRFAKDGKLAIAKYEADLSGKASADLAPAFALTTYSEGADAVKVLTNTKPVSSVRKDLVIASKNLASAAKTADVELQDLVSKEKDAPATTCLKSCVEAKAETQKALARFQ
jgi:hypothetical protein